MSNIHRIIIQASAVRCEIVTTVSHDVEMVSHGERRFPARVMAPYAAARNMAKELQRECPGAQVEVRFC